MPSIMRVLCSVFVKHAVIKENRNLDSSSNIDAPCAYMHINLNDWMFKCKRILTIKQIEAKVSP